MYQSLVARICGGHVTCCLLLAPLVTLIIDWSPHLSSSWIGPFADPKGQFDPSLILITDLAPQ